MSAKKKTAKKQPKETAFELDLKAVIGKDRYKALCDQVGNDGVVIEKLHHAETVYKREDNIAVSAAWFIQACGSPLSETDISNIEKHNKELVSV